MAQQPAWSLRAAAIVLIVVTAGCSTGSEELSRAPYPSLETGVFSSAEVGKGPAEPAGLSDNSDLQDYLRYAALHNPGLEAAFNRWRAALERVPQVTSLPDPRFTYRYYIENVETRLGPQEHAFGLAQTFPWFGKLELRGDVAAEAANAAGERYEEQKLKLFYEVKEVYYEYYCLGRAITVVRENRDLVKYLEGVARIRYKVGAAGHPDVIRAQVELGKLEDRLRTLQDLRGPVVARLNAALNRPLAEPLPWPGSVPYEPTEASDEQLLTWLHESSPELKALEYEIRSRRNGISLAKKDYYPDVTLGLDYIVTGDAAMAGTPDSGEDAVIARVSLKLPVWVDKYAAGVREAEARYRTALKTRIDRENLLGSKVKMTLYRFRDAERKIDLYKNTLLPKARESLKANETSFRTGRATFTDLVDAERVFLAFELAYERAVVDHAQRLSELERLIGRRIPRTGEKAAEPESEETKQPSEKPPDEDDKENEPKKPDEDETKDAEEKPAEK